MPIYEYECPECNTVCEKLLTISNTTNPKMLHCDTCKKDQLMNKCISLSTFKLVGRGWGKDGYVDTYEQTKDLI